MDSYDYDEFNDRARLYGNPWVCGPVTLGPDPQAPGAWDPSNQRCPACGECTWRPGEGCRYCGEGQDADEWCPVCRCWHENAGDC